MNRSTLSSTLEHLAVGAFRQFGRLPLTTAGSIGHHMGRLAWLLGTNARMVTQRNLELCFPELSPAELNDLAQRSFLETSRTFAEIASVWQQPGQPIADRLTQVENQSLMDAAMAQGRGVILLTPHFGNWELSSYYITQRYPLAVMYKPASIRPLDEMIFRARSFNGTELLSADRKGVLGLFSALEQGKAVGVLPDQEPTVSTGVWAPFFGVPALTPKLISKLAQRSKAPALGYGCQRNPDGKSFQIFFQEVHPDLYHDDPIRSATALNQCIEKIIMRDPAQYQWEYKRFKRRPNKAPNPYRKA